MHPLVSLGQWSMSMKIHLIDGTYELFRSFYGAPPKKAPDGRETVEILRALRRQAINPQL